MKKPTSIGAMRIRTMAGLLFEYALPGMRQGFKRPAQATKQCPIRQKQTFPKIKTLFDKFHKYYVHEQFSDYCQKYQQQSSSHYDLGLVLPGEIAFGDVVHHYRCSQAIFDWMYSGNQAWRIGNIRRRQVAHGWIVSDDETRRSCLLRNSLEDGALSPESLRLNELTQQAYGQEYPMRIQKRLKHMEWLCRQAHAEEKNKRLKKKVGVYTLSLTVGDALYLHDLYDLDRFKKKTENKGKKKKKKKKETSRRIQWEDGAGFGHFETDY